MARLASQEKMGFYPTPPFVVDQIKTMLNISSNARLIDTCCGEGEALSIIAKGEDVKTYGVELDKNRFNKAKERLDNVLWADAMHEFICSKNTFSLLWLNPPYDADDTENRKGRLEIQFLKQHWRYLMDGGVMVYIIPWPSLEDVGPVIARKCRQLAIFRFPGDSFWAFNQIVLVCVKVRPRHSEVIKNKALFQNATEAFFSGEFDRMLTTEDACEFCYSVPAVKRTDDLVFRSFRLNPDQYLGKLKKSPAWGKVYRQIFPARSSASIKPLTPLREGHLAMLLASGMMNGEVVGNDGRRLIVKGSARKTVVETTEETETSVKDIRTDRYEVIVRAISLDPIELMTIA